MPKKPTRKSLIKKLDTIFSKYIRLRDADKEGYCRCCTCGEKYHWSKIQAGHFISRKYYATRWDEKNTNAQCIKCNVFQYGAEYRYSLYLGENLSSELYLKSREIVKFADDEIKDKIEIYKEKIRNFS